MELLLDGSLAALRVTREVHILPQPLFHNKSIQAVKILCKLSYAKQKVQSLFEQSQKAHKNIIVLFENETLTPEEFEEIRQSRI